MENKPGVERGREPVMNSASPLSGPPTLTAPAAFSSAPRAYSYLRFSSRAQADGDSIRRQTEASRDYARQHGFVLDESLRINDYGVSAYNGQNVKSGALGEFLREVKAGNVPRGSWLLVESLDRISRQAMTKAASLFLEILDAGITIVTLMDGQVYSQEKVDSNLGSIFMSLVIMSRANDESETKSKRQKEVWKKKRENAASERICSNCPGWLEPSEDGKSFRVIESRAEIVRKMYEDTLHGVGQVRIRRELQERGEECWGRKNRKGKRWGLASIYQILHNPAVIGAFQPCKRDGRNRAPVGEPIPDYYPAIVDKEVFAKVQEIGSGHKAFKGSKEGKISSLFTGLAFSAYDDTPCCYYSTGKHAYLRGYKNRIEENGKRIKGWRYDDFELLFLTTVGGLDYPTIFGIGDAEIAQCDRRVALAAKELEEANAKIKGLVGSIEDLAMQDPPQKAPASVIQRIAQLEASVPVLEAALSDAQRAIDIARNAGRDAIQAGTSLRGLIAQRHDSKVRAALRRDIRRIVDRIEVNFPVVGEDMEPWIVIKFRNGVTRFAFAPNMVLERKTGAVALLSQPGITPIGAKLNHG